MPGRAAGLIEGLLVAPHALTIADYMKAAAWHEWIDFIPLYYYRLHLGAWRELALTIS